MAKVIGITAPNVAKILRASPTTLDAVMRGDVDGLLIVAEQFATIMRELIRQPGTGIVYKAHQASAPGEAPASDLGNLINAIRTAITKDTKRLTKVAVGITKNAPYWEALEDGTRNIEPRPYIRPAYEIGRAGAGDKFVRRMRKKTKRIIAQRRKGRR